VDHERLVARARQVVEQAAQPGSGGHEWHVRVLTVRAAREELLVRVGVRVRVRVRVGVEVRVRVRVGVGVRVS